MSAAETVHAYISRLPGETRRVAHAEWGITVRPEHAGGWPLDVGVRISDGLLRVQAFALPAGESINAWNFLHWNRGTRHIRFACTRAGDIWVHADLPVSAVDERTLDQLLGLVVEGAVAARNAVTAQGAEAAAGDREDAGGWGALS